MTTTITCPHCDKQYLFKPEYDGRRLRCKECKGPIAVGTPSAVPGLATSDAPDQSKLGLLRPLAVSAAILVISSCSIIYFAFVREKNQQSDKATVFADTTVSPEHPSDTSLKETDPVAFAKAASSGMEDDHAGRRRNIKDGSQSLRIECDFRLLSHGGHG